MGVKADPVVVTSEDPRDRLRAFFKTESESLRPTLRRYVVSAGLSAQPIDAVVDDLLQEVVVQALEAADKFDVSRNPVPWLLKIAANLCKRRRAEQAKQHRRFSDAAGRSNAGQRDAEDTDTDGASIFDRIAAACANPEEFLSGRQQAASWLDLVSASDRLVLKNAVLQDMDGAELAAALKITPGAARVRLHRALERLGIALKEQAKDNTP